MAKKKPFVVEQITAYLLSVGNDGDEGVVSFKTVHGWLPAIAANPEREEIIERQVREMVAEHGTVVRKVRFVERVDGELIE